MENKTKLKSWIGKTEMLYLILICVYSAIITFAIYPFIGLADGFKRWQMTQEIFKYGHIISDTLLSPIIPYLQVASYKISNSYGLFTLLQCILFYLSIGIGIKLCSFQTYIKVKKCKIPLWIILAIILILVPTVAIFPALLTDSVWIFILIILLVWIYQLDINNYFKVILSICLIAICVGIRINSIVLFGMIALIFAVLSIKKHSNLIVCCTIMIGSAIGIILPTQITPVAYNASTLGMTWELTRLEIKTGDQQLKQELNQYGDVDTAIARYKDDYLNELVWDNDPPFPAKSIAGENSKGITKLYLKTLTRMPMQFIKNKIHFILRSLGWGDGLITSARGIHYVDTISMTYGTSNTSMQKKLRDYFIKFTDAIGAISLRPFVMGIICLALLVIVWKVKISTKMYWTLFLIGLFYYSSFMINTQAHEYRYYAPTFYIWLIVLVSSCTDIIIIIINKIADTIKLKWQSRKNH